MGGVAVVIDYTPLAQAAALLYESALVAERYEAIRDFFDAHEVQVIEPVRTIIAKGRQYSAADLYQAQTQLHAYGQQAAPMWKDMDVLLVPTAPTHYTIAQMQADPIALNRNLGFYTNFVNLLDYAAISVVGAHLSGMPLNSQLTERGASLVQTTHTSTHYRLYALPGTVPPKPGLKRVEAQGAAIAVEVWDMPLAQVGSFLALIPSPLGLGKLELADGTWVTGFVCEGYALDTALDVTAHGGWRAYMGSLKP
jgi:allophanate hydrolase